MIMRNIGLKKKKHIKMKLYSEYETVNNKLVAVTVTESFIQQCVNMVLLNGYYSSNMLHSMNGCIISY